ncbi:MarR family transcriptional regulator [Salinarchaeum sp. IM2453]|uniref:DUF5830 family protein n=1 Tax=Salinarchaeum sp. IM2453 TaxID=2862870 RepID=UPI001C838397|nr:DUF5830 family protein [Salinarchaeum sp. IM2453]QZA89566.1 MarR family transcriptional regulator [Salinarchaeum sp. IM2453]
MDGDPVELGVELLAAIDENELSIADAIDRIETITTDPTLTRNILREAESRGIIERKDATIQSHSTIPIDFTQDVVQKEGKFTCRRCGTDISTGHFVKLDAGKLGPFGSSCIRKVTGRDE